MSERRFLVVRLGSLGDIVHAFPAVSGLRSSFPDAEIVWLTHPKWEFLVSTSQLASSVWTVDTRSGKSIRKALSHIRKRRFESAIDYQGLWKSAALPFFARVPRRIGFSSETVREAGVPLLYTDRVRVSSSTHIADQNGELSLRAGAKQPVADVKLHVPQKDVETVQASIAEHGISEYVVLSPGGGWQSKCWPGERYGQLAQKLLEQFGVRCVLNIGPGEENLAEAVLRSAGDARPVPYNGSLGQLMALLQNARAVVAGDTGPLHLADAFGTRVVALFGPTDPARNGPYRHSGVVLRSEGAVTTYKRGITTDGSLLHISVNDVATALRGLEEGV